MPGVSSSANCLAASCAAASRLGDTSVARIDCDTSITSITTARLRGMRTSCVGPAIAIGEQHQRQHQQDRGQVPPPRRPFGRNAFQQLHVREAQHPLAAGPAARRCRARPARGRRRGTGRTTRVRSPTASSVRATVMSCASLSFRWSSCRAHRAALAPASAPRRRVATNRTTSAIQSRSVRRVSSGASQRRRVRATSARCAAAAFAKSSRSCSSMVNSRVTPDSVSCRMTSPTVGQFDVARVEHLDAEHLVPPGDGPQRPHPVDRPEEVADDHRHAAAALGPAQRVDGGGQVAAHARRAPWAWWRWCAASPARACGPTAPEPAARSRRWR